MANNAEEIKLEYQFVRKGKKTKVCLETSNFEGTIYRSVNYGDEISSGLQGTTKLSDSILALATLLGGSLDVKSIRISGKKSTPKGAKLRKLAVAALCEAMGDESTPAPRTKGAAGKARRS
ncbi:MAG: hypothetical protein JKY65_14625 [Planctomycetes bacterium]|nr:hypothetical protein [Planctomycetota bacterium]